jgi:hypothetical protein
MDRWNAERVAYNNGIRDFRPILDPKVEFRSAAVLIQTEIQQRSRYSKFRNF